MLQHRLLFTIACDAPSCMAASPERPGQLMAERVATDSGWHLGARHMCPRHATAYVDSLLAEVDA